MRPIHPYRALSDVYGKIDQALISMQEVGEQQLDQYYGGILAALGGRAQFILLGKLPSDGDDRMPRRVKSQMQLYRELVAKANSFPNHQLYIMEPDYHHGLRPAPPSPWVQDPFTILSSPDGTPVFLEPYYFGKTTRAEDQHIAEQVSAYTGYLMMSTRYEFEGGNIIVGDDFMVVGRDTLVANLRRYHPAKYPGQASYAKAVEDITEQFKKAFGMRYVVWLGEEDAFQLKAMNHDSTQGEHNRQPFFHLDLYLTLAGKNSKGEEIVLLGAIEKEDLDKLNHHLRPDWQEVANALDRVEELLDQHHQQEPGPRFKVIRIPMGLRVLSTGKVIPLSMNNCLMEIYQGVKAIYLPRYQSSDDDVNQYLDKLASRTDEVVRELGFEPIWVKGDFLRLAEKHGSLHCIVKVVRRTQTTH